MNITESWLAAEQTAYIKLVQETNSKDGVTCFRGGMMSADRENWTFTSGGLGTGPMARYWGDNPAWCAFSMQARIEFISEDRDHCLEFAGTVLGILQDTTNLKQIGNVMHLRMADLPQEPVAEPHPSGSGRILWRLIMPMELVFATGDEYDA